MCGCAAPGRAAGLAVVAELSPPINGRKALTGLVLGAGAWCASPIAVHNPAPGVVSGRVEWDSGGAAKIWDSPPGPRSGDREGDPARGGLCVRSWRTSPARAWHWPLVEWSRTGNSYAALGFDCDSREAVERAAASCMGAGDLPTPNVYATRTASGHAQVFYLLTRPVHRGEHARAKPLHHLARVSEFYRATLGADTGYTGVLSSNPTHADYATSYPRADPYALTDLASWIPKGWRIPRPATTAEGRNVELFLALCKLALRCSDDGLLTWARRLNSAFAVPLADAEVWGIWRSVCRYRARWHAEGHQQGWLWKQARTGQAGRAGGGCEASGRDSPCA